MKIRHATIIALTVAIAACGQVVDEPPAASVRSSVAPLPAPTAPPDSAAAAPPPMTDEKVDLSAIPITDLSAIPALPADLSEGVVDFGPGATLGDEAVRLSVSVAKGTTCLRINRASEEGTACADSTNGEPHLMVVRPDPTKPAGAMLLAMPAGSIFIGGFDEAGTAQCSPKRFESSSSNLAVTLCYAEDLPLVKWLSIDIDGKPQRMHVEALTQPVGY